MNPGTQAKDEEIEELDDRLKKPKPELHAATDRISLGVELRTRADSLHYKNIQVAPSMFTSQLMSAPSIDPVQLPAMLAMMPAEAPGAGKL